MDSDSEESSMTWDGRRILKKKNKGKGKKSRLDSMEDSMKTTSQESFQNAASSGDSQQMGEKKVSLTRNGMRWYIDTHRCKRRERMGTISWGFMWRLHASRAFRMLLALLILSTGDGCLYQEIILMKQGMTWSCEDFCEDYIWEEISGFCWLWWLWAGGGRAHMVLGEGCDLSKWFTKWFDCSNVTRLMMAATARQSTFVEFLAEVQQQISKEKLERELRFRGWICFPKGLIVRKGTADQAALNFHFLSKLLSSRSSLPWQWFFCRDTFCEVAELWSAPFGESWRWKNDSCRHDTSDQ